MFDVGDFVFLKVSLMSGVTWFRVKGKLAPRYMGPFQVIEKIGDIAYHLNLPVQLRHVHNVFHVSMLKKYIPNPSHIQPYVEVLL